jgi:ribosomal protein S18 acetylase RimI-like enzyme
MNTSSQGTEIEVRMLRPEDETVLQNVASDVFDEMINPDLVTEFLCDSRHHLVVALDGDLVVGFASGVTYLHPDKPLALWINEVGVAPTHQRQGIGQRVMQTLLELGRGLGCEQAWVLTERSNTPARGLYESIGGQIPSDDTILYEFQLQTGGRQWNTAHLAIQD